MAISSTSGLPAVVSILQLGSGTLSSAAIVPASMTVAGVATTLGFPISQIMTTGLGALPTGGATGQILNKTDGGNFDTQWSNVTQFISAGAGLGTSGSATSIALGLAVSSGLSVLGVAGTTNAIPAPIIGAADQVLVVNHAGTAVGFGQVNLATSAAVTGILPGANMSAVNLAVAGAGGVQGVLPVPNGGTNTTALTAFGVVFGNGSAALGATAAGTTGLLLTGNGTLSAPSFQSFNIGSALGTTVLGVPNGGTNTSTLTPHGVLIGEGTATIGISAAGTAGFIFAGNGTTSDPSFQSVASLLVATVAATGGLSILGIGTTGGSLSTGTVTFTNIRYPNVKTATYTAVENDLGGVVAFSTAALATFIIPQATTVVGQNFATGWWTDVVNFGGTTIVVAPATSNLTGIGATTGIGPHQGVRFVSDGTNYQAVFADGPLSVSRVNTAQSFSGGIRIVSFGLGTFTTGTLTLDSGKGPLQFATSSGAFTIAAPANDGELDVLIINGAGASTISFSGYSVGSNTGDTYTTTSTQRFLLMSRTVNGSSTYKWAAFQ